MIIPNSHQGQTKHSWITFYNEEFERILQQYMTSRHSTSDLLFSVSRKRIADIFRRTSRRTGKRITAQTLRRWFCSQMLQLGVQEIYIDAFCGRTPQTVLARHYTDYTPDTLQTIYEKAELTVLRVIKKR
jgi:intergrase/recombinase